MLAAYLLKGVCVGFSVAVPVGPVGLLCIRRTLNAGLLAGFLSGLGAASADALYGLIAGLGLTAASGFLRDQEVWLRGLGGIFLLCLAYRNYRVKLVSVPAPCTPSGLTSAYFSTFLLTLTNPLTVFAFAGIFAALGLTGNSVSVLNAFTLVAGVFAGSSLWWLFLCGAVDKLRYRLGSEQYQRINRFAAFLIGIFGIAALASLLEI